MERAITGFGQDEPGDWFATLDCLRRQHVRHKPPFFNRPWVTTPEGRKQFLGTTLDCVWCDRLELPDDLVAYKSMPEFDETTLPAGLRRDHSVKTGSWGVMYVIAGSVALVFETTRRTAVAGERIPIPLDDDPPRRGPVVTDAVSCRFSATSTASRYTQ